MARVVRVPDKFTELAYTFRDRDESSKKFNRLPHNRVMSRVEDVRGAARLLLERDTHEKAYRRGRCPHRCQHGNPSDSHRHSVRLHFQRKHEIGDDCQRVERGGTSSVQNLAWIPHRAHLLIGDLDVHDRDPVKSAREKQWFAQPVGWGIVFLFNCPIRDVGRANCAGL